MENPPGGVGHVNDLSVDGDRQSLIIPLLCRMRITVVSSLRAVRFTAEVPTGISLRLSVIDSHVVVLRGSAWVIVQCLPNYCMAVLEKLFVNTQESVDFRAVHFGQTDLCCSFSELASTLTTTRLVPELQVWWTR
jgi:hypothetical protein